MATYYDFGKAAQLLRNDKQGNTSGRYIAYVSACFATYVESVKKYNDKSQLTTALDLADTAFLDNLLTEQAKRAWALSYARACPADTTYVVERATAKAQSDYHLYELLAESIVSTVAQCLATDSFETVIAYLQCLVDMVVVSYKMPESRKSIEIIWQVFPILKYANFSVRVRALRLLFVLGQHDFINWEYTQNTLLAVAKFHLTWEEDSLIGELVTHYQSKRERILVGISCADLWQFLINNTSDTIAQDNFERIRNIETTAIDNVSILLSPKWKSVIDVVVAAKNPQINSRMVTKLAQVIMGMWHVEQKSTALGRLGFLLGAIAGDINYDNPLGGYLMTALSDLFNQIDPENPMMCWGLLAYVGGLGCAGLIDKEKLIKTVTECMHYPLGDQEHKLIIKAMQSIEPDYEAVLRKLATQYKDMNVKQNALFVLKCVAA